MRLWHGKAPIAKANEYEKFLIERAVPDYSSINGLIKLCFTRREEEKVAHFLLATIWDSMESIKSSWVKILNLRSTAQKTTAFYWKRRNTFSTTRCSMRSNACCGFEALSGL